MRLVENWFGSGRVVCGDSLFSSFATALELRKKGLYFIGNVKTAHTNFPKQFFKVYQFANRGDSCSLVANVDTFDFIAHAWNDKKAKHFITSCSTSLPGTPVIKRRWKILDDEVDEKEDTQRSVREHRTLHRTKIVEDYYNCAKTIDVHNHFRQGGLGLEQFRKSSWVWRIFFTILGIVETDCFLAYRYIVRDFVMSHSDFTTSLALELINNRIDERVLRNRPAPSSSSSSSSSSLLVKHSLAQIQHHPYYKTKVQQKKNSDPSSNKQIQMRRRCVVCHKLCSYYCISCTEEASNDGTSIHFISVCNFASNKECMQQHISKKEGIVE